MKRAKHFAVVSSELFGLCDRFARMGTPLNGGVAAHNSGTQALAFAAPSRSMGLTGAAMHRERFMVSHTC